MTAIEVQHVKKNFGRVRALDSVSLEVEDGEFVVLLGPSGCGKTTLLRVIAGLETADGGSVAINGRDVTSLPPRKRGIAMVFQNYAVFPHLTVFENVAFGLRMRKAAEADVGAQVRRMAELVQISDLLERYPSQLSGGQRQRVAMARALAVEPDLMLMDEPLSNLDALLRLEMRAELKKLLGDLRTTTLYVTHDQVEAMGLADRIAVMQGGRIVQFDTPLKVYQDPVNTFVGKFIGNPPMNFLNVTLSEENVNGAPIVEGTRVAGPKGLQGSKLLLGVRPEDLELSEGGGTDLECTVVVVEPLGAHLLVTLEWRGQQLKATVPTDTKIDVGTTVHLQPRQERIRWMDAVSGDSLQ